jgi:hypothetical protein
MNDKKLYDITLGENSEKIQLGTGVPTSVQVTWGALTAGAPTVDITVSNDGVNFLSLLAAPEAMSVVGGTTMLLEPSSPYLFIRVETVAGGSTGTYSVFLNKNSPDVI